MSYCCDDMKDHLTRECTSVQTSELGDVLGPVHEDRFSCPDVVLHRFKKSGLTGILIHDGGSSVYQITFCPFCGTKLET